jgi:transcriptional regulator with XRE-family HTH domain
MATKTMKQVSAMLKRVREKKGWSLREASRRSGVSVANLSKLEAGKTGNPTIVTMVAISNAYGIKVHDWF